MTDAPAMSRLNDRDLELLKLDDRLLLPSLKETLEENGRQQSSGFLRRFTDRFSNALGLVIKFKPNVPKSLANFNRYCRLQKLRHGLLCKP